MHTAMEINSPTVTERQTATLSKWQPKPKPQYPIDQLAKHRHNLRSKTHRNVNAA